MSDTVTNRKQSNPEWQMHIECGNANMQSGRYPQAQAAYLRAMEVAEKLLSQALSQRNDMDAIHGFVISCQNLAESYCIMGAEKEAERLLLRAHQKALELMEMDNMSIQFRAEAYRAFQATLIELVEFYRRTECHEKMAEKITESKLSAHNFLQKIYCLFEKNLQN
ncbi:hypothetical protein [Calothrix sp. NIES-3974]|uniref:hypothetical protein n=1 Tax=Calothrix sp. NIES-3974 TaxID=2005462 RepID=UPI000B5F28D2|nr:hypothetical protein [Calothrix sp. NIES-3974]BAZ05636.1 putative TPR domain protein [Calothrix sp. NIES-3974]